jgi:Uma2 family endonuclease
MSALLKQPISLEDFLAWEAKQPIRYEFDGVRAIAMAGGTDAHSAIQINLAIAVGGRLRGGPCQFRNNDLKIQVVGHSRYPDGFVVCSRRQPDVTVVHDPVVVFEVVSESSWATDYNDKNREYAATPSIKRYVILHQDQMAGMMFERIGDDWVGHLLTAASILNMPEIDIEVPLAEFYDGVEFPPAEA